MAPQHAPGGIASPQQEPEPEVSNNEMGLDILAGLTTLGINPALRDRVQEALQQLSIQESEALHASTAGTLPTGQQSGVQASTSGRGINANAAELAAQLRAAEQKMQMSRSIMRKLYYKNVNLEKELAILQANGGLSDAGFGSSLATPLTPSAHIAITGPNAPLSQALHEKDVTIQQLRQALDAARRRCALLEQSVVEGGASGSGRSGGPGSGPGLDSINNVLAQSTLHHQKYKSIREDYNRLLMRRTSTLQTKAASSAEARALLSQMQARLAAEVQEREAEAALYSARLYESERAASDWFVEKRLLEDHIAKLSAEVQERDRLDSEIQTCVATLFERTRQLEGENDVLRRKLVVLDVDVDSLLAEGGAKGGQGERGLGTATEPDVLIVE